MKKQLIPLVALLFSGAMYAQVGIGTLTPHKSAQLEVKSDSRGILIPRVGLLSVTDEQTMAAGNVESLLVYNTTKTDDLKPGYYYWFEGMWQAIATISEVQQTIIQDLDDSNTTNVSLSIVEENLRLTDSDGNFVSIPLTALQKPETVTTLEALDLAKYEYISEDGTSTIIDVPLDVINNFSLITNDVNVRTILETIVRQTKSNVLYNGTQFTYVNELGVTEVIDLTTIIQNNQKTTSVTAGNNVIVTPTVTSQNTDYKVEVASAKGATANTPSTYGVVKEATTNPTVLINQLGELSIDRNQLNSIKTVNENYLVEPSDLVILANANDATLQIKLPSPVGVKGRKLTIKKSDTKNSTFVNVVVDGGATIEGEQDLYTSLPFSGWDFMSDGSQWKIVNKF